MKKDFNTVAKKVQFLHRFMILCLILVILVLMNFIGIVFTRHNQDLLAEKYQFNIVHCCLSLTLFYSIFFFGGVFCCGGCFVLFLFVCFSIFLSQCFNVLQGVFSIMHYFLEGLSFIFSRVKQFFAGGDNYYIYIILFIFSVLVLWWALYTYLFLSDRFCARIGYKSIS